MACKSKVRILTTKEGLREMEAFVSRKITDSKEDIFNLFEVLDMKSEFSGSDYVVIGWNCIKWYDCVYKDVMFVRDSLEHLEALDIPCQFIRVGESPGDVEEIYYVEDYDFPLMYTRTNIKLDGVLVDKLDNRGVLK